MTDTPKPELPSLPSLKRMDVQFRIVYCLFVAILIMFICWNLAAHAWVEAFVISGQTFLLLLVIRLRSRFVRMGYFDGRQSAINSAFEASYRGLTLDEWARAEMERDIADFIQGHL